VILFSYSHTFQKLSKSQIHRTAQGVISTQLLGTFQVIKLNIDKINDANAIRIATQPTFVEFLDDFSI